jgi:hypothetical protein
MRKAAWRAPEGIRILGQSGSPGAHAAGPLALKSVRPRKRNHVEELTKFLAEWP